MLLFFLACFVNAAESICPGGSNPRSDIVWCADFENYNDPSCITGTEPDCARANNLSFNSVDGGSFAILGGDAAVGSGAIVGTAPPGGTGSGWSGYENLPGLVGRDAVSYRFYVKFKEGYLQPGWGGGNHGPSIEFLDSSTGCYGRATLDPYYKGILFKIQDTCAGGADYGIPNNFGDVVLQNNRWYLVEMQWVMNTVCSGSGPYDCNGVGRGWIDGQLVMEYTNLNIRGNSNAHFNHVWTARSYYGNGYPSWNPKILFDNFALSNDATYIGQAQNENSRGTADPLSPYVNYETYNGMMGHKLARDCTVSSGYLRYTPMGFAWRNGALFQSAVTHGSYRDTCTSNPDQAIQISLSASNSGGGTAYERVDTLPRQSVHGWVYLPSSNDYSQTALTGFARYGSGGNWANYLALSVSNGRWAIAQRTNGASPNFITTTETVTTDAWHEFEIIISNTNTVSLMIDRNWLLNDFVLSNPINWAFDPTLPGPRNTVLGVIDFQGTAPFSIYLDDTDIGSASYWSCKGWDSSSCPFSGATPTPTASPTPTPSPDITPPIISSIIVSRIYSESAVVTWTTNEAANSTVEFGVDAGYGSSTRDSNFVTSHSVSLNGLTAGTLYHYRVVSYDAAGNGAASEDANFTTLPPGVTPTPTPSGTPEPTSTPTPSGDGNGGGNGGGGGGSPTPTVRSGSPTPSVRVTTTPLGTQGVASVTPLPYCILTRTLVKKLTRKAGSTVGPLRLEVTTKMMSA